MLCRKLGVSRSGYYAWQHRQDSPRKQDDGQLLAMIIKIHQASREAYGYPRIHAALKTEGVVCGRNRVARIMRENGIKARMARRFRCHRHLHYLFETPNLLLDRPPVRKANRVWVGDVSYIRVNKGWSYVCTVMDQYTRKIIGWSFATQHDAALVREAIHMAAQTQVPHRRTIFHSDQGSEFANKEIRSVLEQFGLRVSMSRRGHCWDNAQMESFFGTLKTEMVYFQRFKRVEEAIAYIKDYIQFYNEERLHSSLGYVPPTQFERMAA